MGINEVIKLVRNLSSLEQVDGVLDFIYFYY